MTGLRMDLRFQHKAVLRITAPVGPLELEVGGQSSSSKGAVTVEWVEAVMVRPGMLCHGWLCKTWAFFPSILVVQPVLDHTATWEPLQHSSKLIMVGPLSWLGRYRCLLPSLMI